MPRKVRIEYEGATYHVMSRGNQRQAIFADDRDREVFLKTVGETCERTGALIYSYVLMGNHYHLLMNTPRGNLVAAMQWLQSTYTARYNARHRECGHLFAGRYKAIPVQSDDPTYGRVVSDYIHLNPARAGMLRGQAPRMLKEYRWSSFPGICGFEESPPWVEGSTVVGWHHWDIRKKRDRMAFWKYLEARALEKEDGEELNEMRSGWYLGGEEFRDELVARVGDAIEGKKRSSFFGSEELRGHDEKEGERIIEAGLKFLGIKDEVRALAKNDPRKQALAWMVRTQTVASNEWVSERLGMGHPSNVSRALARFQMGKGKEIQRLKVVLAKCTD